MVVKDVDDLQLARHIVGRLVMFSSNIDPIETAKFFCDCCVQVKVALFWGRSIEIIDLECVLGNLAGTDN